MNWSWLLGLAFGLLATLMGTINKVFWKLGHNIDSLPPPSTRSSRVPHTIGCVALILNPPLDILSLYFAPQSLFAATAGTGTVFNILVAGPVLGERAGWRDIVGACLICTGCTGVAMSEGSIPKVEDHFESLMARFRTDKMIAFQVRRSEGRQERRQRAA